MGGLFINYSNRFGRQWQVYIEAEGDYRTRAENVGQFFVRNNKNQMVPLSALTRFEPPVDNSYFRLARQSEGVGNDSQFLDRDDISQKPTTHLPTLRHSQTSLPSFPDKP
jgi:hypothetical protein